MTPFNLIAVSNWRQANRLAEAWKQGKNYEELSEEEKEQAQNAYFYLRNQEHVEKYIPTYLTKEDLEKLYPYTSVKKENTKFIYYYAKEINQEQDWIDISNYSKIKKIRVYDSDVSASEDLQYKAILEQIIAQYEITKETGEEYLRYNISCNQEEDIRINNLYIEYEIENEEIQIKDYTIEGYLLKK